MLKTRNKSGFTLVELSLTIGFISVLSLTMIFVLVNMINSYQRGLILKQVNTTGSNIIDEFRGAISNSSAKGIAELCDTVYADDTNRKKCKDDNAYSFVYLVRTDNVTVAGKLKKNIPVYGAFCSGVYSYIWNSGYFFNDEVGKNVDRASFSYRRNDKTSSKADFRLLKVTDPDRSVCVSKVLQDSVGKYETVTTLAKKITSKFNVSSKTEYGVSYADIIDEPFDFLTTSNTEDVSNGANSLALYDLSIYKPAQDTTTRNIFYSGSFTLATIDGGIDITASGNFCAVPNDYLNENFNYCAINKFNFATQANGE